MQTTLNNNLLQQIMCENAKAEEPNNVKEK